MRKWILAILVISVAFVNVSCEKDIELDLGDVAEKLVVEGWINSGETPVVLLSKTYPSYGTINFLDLIDSLYIQGAEVKVTDQNNNTVTLAQVTTASLSLQQKSEIATLFEVPVQFIDFFPIPIYSDTTNTIIGQQFGTYSLEINYNGDTLTSVTSIPAAYPLDSLSYRVKNPGSTFYTVNIHLSLPPVLGNYIRYTSKRNSEPFYPPERSGATWSDLIFAGAENVSLPVERGYNDSTEVDLEDFGLFEFGDTVTIAWKNIDKETYDFWYSLENDGGDTPFSSPVKAVTNIQGGLGIWGGAFVSYEQVIID